MPPEGRAGFAGAAACRSEEHTSELQSQSNLVCRLLLEKKKTTERPLEEPLDDYNYRQTTGVKSVCSGVVRAYALKSRIRCAIQRWLAGLRPAARTGCVL